ncbi:hypothetical protein [Agrobacterium sp.]|uniref:hypothetical protein n=1 Tax=Agrobacterium sp. TaxID=361 RepID=UPI0028AE44AA|nr:hypothetical protein [Agrobacterium sp.]
MSMPDSNKQSGMKDEILAGEYVLGALPRDVHEQLTLRIRQDRSFALMVSRWQANLQQVAFEEQVSHSAYAGRLQPQSKPNMAAMQARHHAADKRPVLKALWNSAGFWRVVAFTAVLFALALSFTH